MLKKNFKNIAIITAGGSGKRMKHKTKKQFIEIAGRPLLFWTIDNFVKHPQIDGIILTLPEHELEETRSMILKEYPENIFYFVKGGKERQDSIYNALCNCPDNTGYVLIHDGVRPFINKEEITELLKKAKTTKAVIPVFKVKNTIKQIQGDKITDTVPRQNLVNALTPQVFEYALIKQCHEQARGSNIEFTDDASLLEHFGYPVSILECSAQNFKVTDIYDLQIAEFIIKNKLKEK